MLTAYVTCLAVGGGLLGLSLFGDFLDGDVDVSSEIDVSGDSLGDASAIISLRTLVYAVFGFGASGTALHLLRDGASAGTTAWIAGATGLAAGAIVSATFGYLRRTEAGVISGEESFVGLTGKVTLEVGPGSPGFVRVARGDRRFRIRARVNDAYADAEALAQGRQIVVVEMKDGIAAVAPVDVKLLED